MTALLTMAIALIIGPASSVTSAQSSDHAHRPHPSITVTGEGEVQAVPDQVAITLGVVTEAETAQQALQANNQAMQQLFETLDRQQIAKQDRQTTRFDVSPQYRPDQPSPRSRQQEAPQSPRIVGYQVTNTVRVQVNDVSKLGNVLDTVVSAGSNRINGIQFSIEERESLLKQARQRAIENARDKAKLFAQAAGVSLGSVVTIREQGGASPVPQPRYQMAAARSVPIAAGEQTITASVHVEYELNVTGD